MQSDGNRIAVGPVKKAFYLIVGIISLVAGIVGIFLPVIPTTPFILLSAWCFYRSSEKFYNWVISNERFGPTIENYHEGRGITLNTKLRAMLMMWITITLSVYFFISNMFLSLLLFCIAVSVSIYLYRLPTLVE